MRWIIPSGPGMPIGAPWEMSGMSAVTMQLSIEGPLREQLDGKLDPRLATSYDVVTDPPSLTFHLRQGVKFSDGTDFNAQALKWNLQQTITAGMNVGTTQFWKSIDVLDDYTIRVNFTMWQNRLIRSFADAAAWAVSPTAFQKNGIDWMRWHMVGTGPFVQTDFQRDVSATAVRNPNYYEQGKPYLNQVQIYYVTDEMTRIALFKSGGAEALDCNTNGRVANDLQAAGYKIITQPSGVVSLLPDSLNADSPWSNLKVRQAAEYAIDKDSISKTFGYGYTQPAYQFNFPVSMAFDSSIQGRKYDMAKAKQLLTDAGYPNGFKTAIIAQSTANRDIIVAVQSYLSKVGIQCDLQFPEAAQFSSLLTGWHNALLFSSSNLWANPNTSFTIYFGAPKSTTFLSLKKPDGWVDIINASLVVPKPDSVAMQKCENALYNDATVIPLYYSVAEYAVTNAVQDAGIGTRGASYFWVPENAWLSK